MILGMGMAVRDIFQSSLESIQRDDDTSNSLEPLIDLPLALLSPQTQHGYFPTVLPPVLRSQSSFSPTRMSPTQISSTPPFLRTDSTISDEESEMHLAGSYDLPETPPPMKVPLSTFTSLPSSNTHDFDIVLSPLSYLPNHRVIKLDYHFLLLFFDEIDSKGTLASFNLILSKRSGPFETLTI